VFSNLARSASLGGVGTSTSVVEQAVAASALYVASESTVLRGAAAALTFAAAVTNARDPFPRGLFCMLLVQCVWLSVDWPSSLGGAYRRVFG